MAVCASDQALTMRTSLGIPLLGSDFHEAPTHLLHDELIAKTLDRIQFAVMP